MRNRLGDLLPQIIIKISRRMISRYGFFGNYPKWEEALKASEGYDSDMILDKVKNALIKVKRGEAIYERDSVLFDEIQYSWPLLAGLLWVASCGGNRLNLIDFGGSLGSSYYQNKKFLSHLAELNWSIVEQKKFVECGKQYFEDDHLKFYYTIDDCLKEQRADTILLSSVIQYLEKPYDLLRDVKSKGFKYIIFDRTAVTDTGDDRITIQKVPPEIYAASYPAWFFNREKFLNFFLGEYELMADFESNDLANIPSVYKGYIFKSRNDD